MTLNVLHIEIQPAWVALDRFGTALESAMAGKQASRQAADQFFKK